MIPFMKPTRTLLLLGVATLLLAPLAHSQDARTVTLRFRRASDSAAVRNAVITIDHTIDAGATDSLGMVKVLDLEDGGHIVEALAKGYEAYFDKFVSGAKIQMPIDLELLPVELVLAAARGRIRGRARACDEGRGEESEREEGASDLHDCPNKQGPRLPEKGATHCSCVPVGGQHAAQPGKAHTIPPPMDLA